MVALPNTIAYRTSRAVAVRKTESTGQYSMSSHSTWRSSDVGHEPVY